MWAGTMTVTPQRARVVWTIGCPAALLAIFLSWVNPVFAQESLPVLGRVGPWPEVSGLIGFQGRLWLVNSVKWENHNSADLYTYAPATGDIRYERQLFSQDAGRPAIHNGLLYWPFEDARASMGWGQFAVTDGDGWHFGVIPTGQIFHTHAFAEMPGGRLVAATSAWRAGLDVSSDGGRTWRRIYEHPTPEVRVSRIVDLYSVGDVVIGPLSEAGGLRLLVSDGETVRDLPGWPQNSRLLGGAVFHGWFYGLAGGDGGTAVWRSDGTDSAPMAAPRADWGAVNLTAGEDGLWAVGGGQNGGAAWFSPDGLEWQKVYILPGGSPREAVIFGGRLYAAGAGDDGRGILWGPAPAAIGAAGDVEPAPPPLPTESMRLASFQADSTWEMAAARLDAVLDDPDADAGHRRALRDAVYDLVMAAPPLNVIADRLHHAIPDRTYSVFGGAAQVSAQAVARWTLLWGMALRGAGAVPLDLLSEPWETPANRAEKYFATPPAAMWAAAAIGQRDGATIEVLIERLENPANPLWLRGDAVGALSVLTGQRFGYDAAAWRTWWSGSASR